MEKGKEEIERNALRLAVMAKQIENIEGNISEIKADIKSFLGEVREHYLTKAELKQLMDPVEERVTNLENFKDWAIKLIIGGIITAGLVALLK